MELEIINKLFLELSQVATAQTARENGNPLDDRLENLEVMSQSEHMKRHQAERRTK